MSTDDPGRPPARTHGDRGCRVSGRGGKPPFAGSNRGRGAGRAHLATTHNLLTYQSKQEPLDGWALDEWIGHYVNYRKLLSPNARLLPESDFQLYAVATRHPQGLARRRRLQPTAWPGVYDVPWGTPTIRLIVLNTIAPHPRNAAWELFSTQHDRIRHGAQYYRPRRPGTWDLLYRLYLLHLLEDPSLATTIEEYVRDLRQQFLHSLTPEEQQAVLDQ